jgi:RNA polymerase I-specific transcription initiation factor RRN3
VDETADKLDSMMELLLSHLGRRFASGQGSAAWDTVLGHFERCVLHTHRSKFVQYVAFYSARRDPPAACRALLGGLLARLADRGASPITRSASAAYAASFLARWEL